MDITMNMLAEKACSVVKKVYEFPEVFNIRIKGIDIPFSDDKEKIFESIKKGYHDLCSDVDMKVFIKLHRNRIDIINDALKKGFFDDNFIEEYFGNIYHDNNNLGFCLEEDDRYDIPNYSVRFCTKEGIKIDLSLFFMDIEKCAYECEFENKVDFSLDKVDRRELIAYFSGKIASAENKKVTEESLKKCTESSIKYIKYSNYLQDAFWITAVFAVSKLKRKKNDTASDFTMKLFEITEEAERMCTGGDESFNQTRISFYTENYALKKDGISQQSPYNMPKKEEQENTIRTKGLETAISELTREFDGLARKMKSYDPERIHIFNELWRCYGGI